MNISKFMSMLLIIGALVPGLIAGAAPAWRERANHVRAAVGQYQLAQARDITAEMLNTYPESRDEILDRIAYLIGLDKRNLKMNEQLSSLGVPSFGAQRDTSSDSLQAIIGFEKFLATLRPQQEQVHFLQVLPRALPEPVHTAPALERLGLFNQSTLEGQIIGLFHKLAEVDRLVKDTPDGKNRLALLVNKLQLTLEDNEIIELLALMQNQAIAAQPPLEESNEISQFVVHNKTGQDIWIRVKMLPQGSAEKNIGTALHGQEIVLQIRDGETSAPLTRNRHQGMSMSFWQDVNLSKLLIRGRREEPGFWDGVTVVSLNRLKDGQIVEMYSHNLVGFQCPICRENIKKGDEVIVLKCGHKMHENCGLDALQGHQNQCPICSQNIHGSQDYTIKTAKGTRPLFATLSGSTTPAVPRE